MAGWKILEATLRVLQSHQHISVHNPVHINVVQVHNPQGSGKILHPLEHSHRAYIDKYTRSRQNRLIRTCEGDFDHLCLPKAIILGWYYQTDRKRYRELTHDDDALQRLARKRLTKTGIPDDGPCGMDAVKMLQAGCNARIIIYDKQRLNAVVHCGPKHATTIHVCLFEEHYTLIRSINAYMNTTYYCVECRVRFIIMIN